MSTTLYRFYDSDGVLLYVGVTRQAWWRWGIHRAAGGWWESTDHVNLEHFQYREQALAAEKAAIKAERPVFNKMHRVSDVVIHQADQPWKTDEIAEAFRVAHREGRVRRGAMLPPVLEMAERFCTSKKVIQTAMKILRAERLVYGGMVGEQWMIWDGQPQGNVVVDQLPEAQ